MLLKFLFKKKRSFEPQVFNDPIAKGIEWNPVKKGLNLGSGKELDIKPNLLILKAKKSEYVGLAIFVIVQMFFIFGLYCSFESLSLVKKVLSCSFNLFITYSLFLTMKNIRKKIEIDLILAHIKMNDEKIPFSTIIGIQLLEEYIRTKNNCFYAYEVNIVLHNSKRINLTDLKNYYKAKHIAEVIAEKLNVSLWDMRNPNQSRKKAG